MDILIYVYSKVIFNMYIYKVEVFKFDGDMWCISVFYFVLIGDLLMYVCLNMDMCIGIYNCIFVMRINFSLWLDKFNL